MKNYWPLLFLLILSFAACKPQYNLVKNESTTYRLDSTAVAAASIDAIIEPYKAQVSTKMEKHIGEVAMDMEKRKPECLLGNFVADAIMDIGSQQSAKQVDFAVSNYGGMRIPNLPAGPVSVGMMYELMPFENMLVVVELDGPTTRKFLNHIASQNGWPVSAELQMMINPTASLAEMIMIDGSVFDESRNYRIITSDYVANGGDRCDFLKDQPREDLGLLFRDGLIQYVEQQTSKGEKIKSQIQGRVHYAE